MGKTSVIGDQAPESSGVDCELGLAVVRHDMT